MHEQIFELHEKLAVAKHDIMVPVVAQVAPLKPTLKLNFKVKQAILSSEFKIIMHSRPVF